MTTKDDQETLRLLVQHVSRAFYDPKFVVIMDQLSRHPVLKDDDLAGRIGLQAKELNKYMAVLVNDKLIEVHRQNELKEGAQRSVGKQYYYIDYKHYCNVVKWRVSEMHRTIDSTLRNELDNKGYICPNCKSTFSPLEADRLLDISRGTFVCDVCPTSPGGPHEVIPNEDEDKLRGSKDRMERFNRQTRFVRESLRKTESMMLPAFDVAQWIRNNAADAERQRNALGALGAGGGLRIAGSGGAGGVGGRGKQDEASISVLMSVDKDEATRRREREAEAEAKRQQNVMPSWHMKSTITNDLTALGVAAVGRQHAPSSGTGSKLSTNETILSSLSRGTDVLSGLGKPRPEVKEKKPEIVVVDEEDKTEEEQTAEFYDQYYAQLEARSAAQSASHTPQIPTLGTSDFGDSGSGLGLGSGFGSQTNMSLGIETGSGMGLGLGLSISIGSREVSMEGDHKPDIAALGEVERGTAGGGGEGGRLTFLTSSSSGSLKRSRSGSLDASTSPFSCGIASGAGAASIDTTGSKTLKTGYRGPKALRSNSGTPIPAPVPILPFPSHVSGSISLEGIQSRSSSRSPSMMDVGSVPITDYEDEGTGRHGRESEATGESKGVDEDAEEEVGEREGQGVREGKSESFSLPVPTETPVDEPVVMVGGEPMPLPSVTQEIADEKMTAEEYTIWVELVMNIQ